MSVKVYAPVVTIECINDDNQVIAYIALCDDGRLEILGKEKQTIKLTDKFKYFTVECPHIIKEQHE